MNNTPGHAIPLRPVIEVPRVISKWDDAACVLSQLKPLDEICEDLSKEYLFGFLVGMIIGDAAQSRTKKWHRHIGLVLSKRHETNKKIGDFACVCARSLALRMHAIKDQAKPGHKPNGFYEWVSQASPVVDWIFNVVRGL